MKGKLKSAEMVSTKEGRQYHIGLAPGEVAPYIILTGDPGRIEKISGILDKPKAPIANREYKTVTGKWKGVPVSVMATGMGPDNVEIAVIELSQIVKNPTYIRIGTSGSLQKNIKLDDYVISTGAVRLETTSLYFVHEGYPCVAHYEVVLALTEAATRRKANYHLGLTGTGCGFYGVQGRKIPGFTPRYPDIPEQLGKMNVANLEMETSTLFSLATFSGVRAGTMCLIIANRPDNTFIDPELKEKGERELFYIVLDAVKILSEMDKIKGKGNWLPSMKV